MTAKVVVRLLDAAGHLLGWAECLARPKGDGCLWPMSPVVVTVDEAGFPSVVSLHWCEVNVESRVPFPPDQRMALKPGQSVTLYEGRTPILTVGTPPGPLPAVTVRARQVIGVPVASIGMQPGR